MMRDFTYDATRAKGAVVEFNPKLSDEEIRRAMQELVSKGILVRVPEVHGFDDRVGYPVFYIP